MTDTTAGAGEWERFEAWVNAWGSMNEHHRYVGWEAWQARAALPAAQDSERALAGALEPLSSDAMVTISALQDAIDAAREARKAKT